MVSLEKLNREVYLLSHLLRRYRDFQFCFYPSAAVLHFSQRLSPWPITRLTGWSSYVTMLKRQLLKREYSEKNLQADFNWCVQTRERVIQNWQQDLTVLASHVVSLPIKPQRKLQLSIRYVKTCIERVSPKHSNLIIRSNIATLNELIQKNLKPLAPHYYSIPILHHLPPYQLAGSFAEQFGNQGSEITLARDILGSGILLSELYAVSYGLPIPWPHYLSLMLLPDNTPYLTRLALVGCTLLTSAMWHSWRQQDDLGSALSINAGAIVFALSMQVLLPLWVSKCLTPRLSHYPRVRHALTIFITWGLGLISYMLAMLLWQQMAAPAIRDYFEPVRQGECVGDDNEYCLSVLMSKHGYASNAEANTKCHKVVNEFHPDHKPNATASEQQHFTDCRLIRRLLPSRSN